MKRSKQAPEAVDEVVLTGARRAHLRETERRTPSKNGFLKKPCAICPFRSDRPGYLTRRRVRDLERDIVVGQQDFYCHETIDYDGDPDDDGEERPRITPLSRRCAGMTILCEKINRPTQMMRIDERLGFYDRRKMHMDAPVFDSFDAMRKAQEP